MHGMIGKIFENSSRTMIDAFEERAKSLYG